MSSGGLVFGCIGTLVCLVLQSVGLGTPHWYTLEYSSSLLSFNAGLFQLCLNDVCYTYISYGFNWSVDYIAIVGSQCLGALLLLIALIVGLSGCNNQYQRGPVQNVAGLAIGACTCLIGGAIWFFVRFYVQYESYFTLFSSIAGIKLGYSFYLCAVSAGLTLVLAITLCIVGGNMERPAHTVAPAPQPLIIMGTQQQQQFGQPNPGYSHDVGPPSYGQQNGAFPAYNDPVKGQIP